MRAFPKQRGVALLEFALSLSLLIAIVFGITEFGRAIFQYNTLPAFCPSGIPARPVPFRMPHAWRCTAIPIAREVLWCRVSPQLW